MFEALQAPLFFGLIAAFVTTLGLLAVALRSDWSLRYADLFGLAAAGMLATMAFLHIIPEAFALTSQAPVWLAFGFFGGLLLHYLIRTLFPEREASSLPSEAITPILAIAAHSFIDGVVYSVTFASSFSAGVFTALGLILHDAEKPVSRDRIVLGMPPQRLNETTERSQWGAQFMTGIGEKVSTHPVRALDRGFIEQHDHGPPAIGIVRPEGQRCHMSANMALDRVKHGILHRTRGLPAQGCADTFKDLGLAQDGRQ